MVYCEDSHNPEPLMHLPERFGHIPDINWTPHKKSMLTTSMLLALLLLPSIAFHVKVSASTPTPTGSQGDAKQYNVFWTIKTETPSVQMAKTQEAQKPTTKPPQPRPVKAPSTSAQPTEATRAQQWSGTQPTAPTEAPVIISQSTETLSIPTFTPQPQQAASAPQLSTAAPAEPTPEEVAEINGQELAAELSAKKNQNAIPVIDLTQIAKNLMGDQTLGEQRPPIPDAMLNKWLSFKGRGVLVVAVLIRNDLTAIDSRVLVSSGNTMTDMWYQRGVLDFKLSNVAPAMAPDEKFRWVELVLKLE